MLQLGGPQITAHGMSTAASGGCRPVPRRPGVLDCGRGACHSNGGHRISRAGFESGLGGNTFGSCNRKQGLFGQIRAGPGGGAENTNNAQHCGRIKFISRSKQGRKSVPSFSKRVQGEKRKFAAAVVQRRFEHHPSCAPTSRVSVQDAAPVFSKSRPGDRKQRRGLWSPEKASAGGGCVVMRG